MQKKQKEQYDRNKVTKAFEIGDKVLMKRMEIQHWHHDKFGKKWKDSYYIHNKFDNRACKLYTINNKILKNSYNSDHLKSYIKLNKLELIIII